ncbi:MAG: lipopolysaccharide transport periplasmic protein LptA [bacterium]|nr:lipopolysaccharide transport periplasmic protein LptA [bacterium]
MFKTKKLILSLFFLGMTFTDVVESQVADSSVTKGKWDNLSSTNVPTTITSDSMTLKNKENRFVYTGNVVLDKGDLKMTSDRLEGKYNEGQGIEDLEALDNVVITKGAEIKARSNKAVYDQKTETLVLTDNPEVTQNQSILNADLVRIFLQENRSTAEGNVRVKLIEKNG